MNLYALTLARKIYHNGLYAHTAYRVKKIHARSIREAMQAVSLYPEQSTECTNLKIDADAETIQNVLIIR